MAEDFNRALETVAAPGVDLAMHERRAEVSAAGSQRLLTREDLLRRAAVGGAAILAGAGFASVADAAELAATPRRGGTFRLGVTGSVKDYIDGQAAAGRADQARILTAWETLVEFDRNNRVRFTGLAEEITPQSASVWTVRVRNGVEFSNGKTLDADDVIYSIRRMLDPKVGAIGGAALSSVDPNRIKKLDKRTVRMTLKRPDVTLLDGFAQYVAGIVPVGYSPKTVGRAKPNIGTGPYMLESFTPGQRSVHVRNPNYWRSGQAYFDRVVIIDLASDTARVNALLAGQIDAMTDVPAAQVPVVNGHPGTRVLESASTAWTPITMRVDVAPFTDVRVRQAMRLIADRPEMVTQALAGHGSVGNDLYAILDPAYHRALPQRQQDIDKAKFLLKSAGQEGLTIDLQSTNGALGMNEGAQVFAEQATAAGVRVNVVTLEYGAWLANLLKWTFSTTFWGARNYLPQVGAGSLPTSPYNETHWPDEPRREFVSLYKRALRTLDFTERTAIPQPMQTLEYRYGGYIIWGFSPHLDGYSTKVRGLKANDKGVMPLNTFGYGYRSIGFG